MNAMRTPLAAINSGESKNLTNPKLPPWIYPPAEAEPFDWQGAIGIPNQLATPATSIFSFVVPRGKNGIIRAYANQLVGGLFVDGSGSIVWSITHDLIPFRYYNNILFSLGNVNNPTYHPFGLRVFDGQKISFNVFNSGIVPGGEIITARMMGYYYQKNLDDPKLWMAQ